MFDNLRKEFEELMNRYGYTDIQRDGDGYKYEAINLAWMTFKYNNFVPTLLADLAESQVSLGAEFESAMMANLSSLYETSDSSSNQLPEHGTLDEFVTANQRYVKDLYGIPCITVPELYCFFHNKTIISKNKDSCQKCGLTFKSSTGYVCGNNDCPVFTKSS